MTFLSILALLLLPADLQAAPEERRTSEAACPALGEKGACKFGAGGWEYAVEPISCDATRTRGARSESFHLGPKATTSIERLSFAEFQGDLIVVMHPISEGEEPALVLRLDGKALTEKWRLKIPAFNVSGGLIRGKNLYIAGIGLVGKVDLAKGKFVWSRDGLHDSKSGSFTSFAAPRARDGFIVFEEELSSQKYKRPKTVRVEDKTGKVFVE